MQDVQFSPAGKRVTVMGLGCFGGGVGAVRFLVHAGAQVLVTDIRSADDLRISLDALSDLDIEYRAQKLAESLDIKLEDYNSHLCQ